MPRPPPIPRAVVSRNCCPQPSPFGAELVQQPPWNRRTGSGRRRRPAPSAEAVQAAEAAVESAAARAAAWRPWTPPTPPQLTPTPVPNAAAAQAVTLGVARTLNQKP
ncbi:unnamed protein product [Symbiodinium natans]|uniref:Uncharacterized protein n=1 Tax=Symbiodinium natans TaxID=878477 RepID=A0A812PQH4_9DINO|nr:unnamed protein product [Symbiodinium natans]